MTMASRKWTRKETILAMDLYTRVPFSKIGKSNPEIIELSRLIGRTPDAVALKMSNLAHFDPKLRERNVSGMSHASKLDPLIYEEFAGNIEELSFQAQNIIAELTNSSIAEMIPELEITSLPEGEYREQQTKVRVGQYFFRLSVLTAYGNACCVTGLKNKELLVASHIKPWRVSNAQTERTNPSNGLCLNSLHDKAFDKGFITLDKNYRIVNSRFLKDSPMDEKTRDWFDFYNHKTIVLPDKYLPGSDFIKYHNDVVFRG